MTLTRRRLTVEGSEFRVRSLTGFTDPRPPVGRTHARGAVRLASATALAEREKNRPTFVIVHGIGTSHRTSERLQSELAWSGDVHSIDLPGFGGTRHPTELLTIDDYARLLGDALERLDIEAAVVIGHSLGTQVAVSLAAVRPAQVSRLVLVGPVTDPRRASLRQSGIDLARNSAGQPVSLNAMVFGDYLRCGAEWFLTELRPMLDYPLIERVSDAGCPVLVVRGTADPVARTDWASDVAAAAADGELIEIAGHRHHVQHTGAGEVAAGIRSFAGVS